MNPNARKGSTLESLFQELGELTDLRLATRKKLIADQLREAMKSRKVTPSRMARLMKTSRPVVYRMLDPNNVGLTLETLAKASTALGLDLEVKLEEGAPSKGRPAPEVAEKRARALREMVHAYDGTPRKGRKLLEALLIAEREGVPGVDMIRRELATKVTSKRRAA